MSLKPWNIQWKYNLPILTKFYLHTWWLLIFWTPFQKSITAFLIRSMAIRSICINMLSKQASSSYCWLGLSSLTHRYRDQISFFPNILMTELLKLFWLLTSYRILWRIFSQLNSSEQELFKNCFLLAFWRLSWVRIRSNTLNVPIF